MNSCCNKCVPGMCPRGGTTEAPKPCIGCDTCPNGFNDGCNECECVNGEPVCTQKLCQHFGEAYCQPDCHGVTCDSNQLICGSDEIAVTLPGQCCQECVQS